MNLKFEISNLKFDERGLIPAIVQDARTHEALTLAYMNEESLRRTLETGETHFWSRSRKQLWHKGATSGNTQQVVAIRADCDSDALVVQVNPRGAACHTGARSCFSQDEEGETNPGDQMNGLATQDKATAATVNESLGALLERLYALLADRREKRPEGSYTTYLFDEGLDKILKKIGEESAETIIAAKNAEHAPLVAETSDLLFHLTVLLVERGVTLEDVRAELARRHQRGNEE